MRWRASPPNRTSLAGIFVSFPKSYASPARQPAGAGDEVISSQPNRAVTGVPAGAYALPRRNMIDRSRPVSTHRCRVPELKFDLLAIGPTTRCVIDCTGNLTCVHPSAATLSQCRDRKGVGSPRGEAF